MEPELPSCAWVCIAPKQEQSKTKNANLRKLFNMIFLRALCVRMGDV
jgi:hypothetical protein